MTKNTASDSSSPLNETQLKVAAKQKLESFAFCTKITKLNKRNILYPELVLPSGGNGDSLNKDFFVI
jgi:hypothetical protein